MPMLGTIILLLVVVNRTISTNTLEAPTFHPTMEFTELHRSLRFEPPEIDFGTWSVGVARSHKVTLVNENANRSVYLSSVSGKTPFFYSSFFESRVVPPLQNTTFEVVFLPRKSAVSSDYLLVHTSFGQAQLLVKGEGLECPYRLQPIVGIKAPLNALLTPEIFMYNPHSRPLQIVEVYSSGGQFQLELPSGLESAPQALWEIPPHTTKPVIRLKFYGNSAGNHTAYIRIKIAPQSDDVTLSKISEDVLVVPIEFEIYPEHGMYASNPVLDFGRLTNMKYKKSHQINLQLRHSDKSYSADNVSIVPGESLITGLRYDDKDGSVILDTHKFNETTSLDEVVMLQAITEDNKTIGPKFSVRVRAQIFKGMLHYNRNTTVFITGVARSKEAEKEIETETETRMLNVRNDFEMPLQFLSLSMANNESELSEAIQMDLAADYRNGFTTLQPGQSFDLVQLKLLNTSMRFKSKLVIKTNITDFEMPVVVCTGRLHVMTFNEPLLIPGENFSTELNIGTVPLGEMSQDGFIVLYNTNPITVRLTNWNFKSPQGVYFHTTSFGCMRPAALELFHSNQSVKIESSNFRFCSQLNEHDISVFQVAVQSYKSDILTSTLQIWTSYETILTTIVFHTWNGKLEVEQGQLHFKNCFPGKICVADLKIYSTFQQPIHLTSINFSDPSIRFENEYSKNLIFALTPNAATRLGRIFFEPALHCQHRCYLPQDEKYNNLAFPNHLVKSENNNFYFDETELRRRTELYRQMKWYFRDIYFTVRSRELRQLQLQAFIDIEWPKLIKNGKYKFPNIEAGKSQEHIIKIKNPADKPILVDFFLSDPRYAQQTKLSLPLEVVTISSSCYLTDKHVFSLPNQRNYKPNAPVLIPPKGSKDVLVRFDAPSHERDTFCTLLHVRNNLTLYEAVWLSARVVQSQFRFGNRKPGSSTPLLYDLQDKHLVACPAPVVAKRSFTARNTGEVPIWIETFLIDDQECEGYGFKVLNCGKGFELKTNQSRKIEIAFRPDFTASRVTRLLHVRTNLSYQINYTLHAQLPPTNLLEPCTESIKRPFWEDQIRMSGLFLLLSSFILVIASAHVDAESINQAQSALYAAREKGPVHATFNLRNIAVKAAAYGSSSSISNGSSAANSISTSNGRHQNKNNNQYLNLKSSNSHQQQPKKQRTTTMSGASSGGASCASGASGLNLKKFPINLSASSPSAVRNVPCIDPFCVTDHGDSVLGTPEVCSKTPPVRNEKSKNDEQFDQKPAILVSARHDCKKQKTPPLSLEVSEAQTTPKQAKANLKGKPKNGATTTTTTTPPPPAAQNPIIELMDKEFVCEEKRIDKSSKGMEKNSTNTKASIYNTASTVRSNASSTVNLNTSKAVPSKTTKTSSTAVIRTTPPLAQKIHPINNKKLENSASMSEHSSNSMPKTNTQHNKYGKTPGRERRKEKNESNHRRATTLSAASSSSTSSNGSNTTNAKRSERKDRKALKTLDDIKRLNAIKTGQLQSTPLFEVTGTQKVSLDDILEVANKNENSTVVNSKSKSSTTPVSFDYQSPLDKAMQQHIETKEKPKPLSNEPIMSNSFEDVASIEFKNKKVAELGPIGTKKSPSSTPVWESVGVNCATISSVTPLQPKPTDSNSFFSTFMDTAEPDYAPTTPFMEGVSTTDLYELRKAQAELRRQLSANEYLLKVRQQQLKDQLRRQQQKHHQQNMLQSMATAANWSNTGDTTAAWLPINFDAHRNNTNNWQASTPVRPPPGLGVPIPIPIPIPTPTTTTTVSYSNGLNNARHTLTHNTFNNNNNNNTAAQKEQDQTRAFDPFSSLSTIWADNWKQLNNKDENGNHGQGQNQGQGYQQ